MLPFESVFNCLACEPLVIVGIPVKGTTHTHTQAHAQTPLLKLMHTRTISAHFISVFNLKSKQRRQVYDFRYAVFGCDGAHSADGVPQRTEPLQKANCQCHHNLRLEKQEATHSHIEPLCPDKVHAQTIARANKHTFRVCLFAQCYLEFN